MKHLRNAETQMAVDLRTGVDRFIKARKGRLALAHKLVKLAGDLAQASELIHAREPAEAPLTHAVRIHPSTLEAFDAAESGSGKTATPKKVYYPGDFIKD